ncbi:MAG: hypothetical protein C0609_02115 [Deltaproteobacteria bacterium]|nr:MAG: hypothetical protein C0609_02115 [Deltaproteobacteria bacterium]
MGIERDEIQESAKLTGKKTSKLYYFITLLLAWSIPAVAVAGADISSETIVRFYEREDYGGDNRSLAPLYEYLTLEMWRERGTGLSFHSQLWGRADLADKSGEKKSDGEIIYGYLQYLSPGVDFRVGRQSIYEGVANEPLDGGSISFDLGGMASLSLYGGPSVSMAEEDGRSGDLVYGGRLSHTLPGVYSLGLSYKSLSNDSDVAQELAGVDASLFMIPSTSVMGRSTINVESGEWAEHSYEALILVGDFAFRPHFWTFDYAEIFDAGDKTPGPFQFLADGEEQVTVVGAAVDFQLTEDAVMIEVKGDSYNYEERNESANYAAVALEVRTAEITGAGAELGRMEGETSDNSYTIGRGYAQWRSGIYLLSGDIVYAAYDEPVLGEDQSLFLSLGGGMTFMGGALTLKVSGDYTSGPYFDEDLRAMVTCDYHFTK